MTTEPWRPSLSEHAQQPQDGNGSEPSPEAAPTPPPQAPGNLLAIVVEVVQDVASLKAAVARHESRLVGAESGIITLSGQVDQVAGLADRTEGEVRQMKTSLDVLVTTASRLEVGQTSMQQTLEIWTPQIVGLRTLLEAKAVTEQEHLAELRILARRQKVFQRGARGVGLVAGGVITTGALVTAVLNLRPLWTWSTQYPPVAIVVTVVVALVLTIAGAFLFRVLPWPG